MLDEGGFGHVNRQLADVGNVIADAFKMFGNEEQTRVTSSGGRLGDHHFD